MFKVTRILLVAVVAAALAFGVASAQQGKAEGEHQMKEMHKDMPAKEVTMKGEVLDLYCFMNHPDTGQGAGHAKCAKSCINKGLPIGFLSDGEVYLIIGKDHDPVASMVADFAGKQSTIKGKVMMHNGVKAIELISIAPAS